MRYTLVFSSRVKAVSHGTSPSVKRLKIQCERVVMNVLMTSWECSERVDRAG